MAEVEQGRDRASDVSTDQIIGGAGQGVTTGRIDTAEANPADTGTGVSSELTQVAGRPGTIDTPTPRDVSEAATTAPEDAGGASGDLGTGANDI